MEFLISRTSGKSLNGAKKRRGLSWLDWRTVKTLDEARKAHWGKEFFANGVNHREENGLVVRELPNRHGRTIEIDSLNELIAFCEKHGRIVLGSSGFKEVPWEIEIYDDYRE